MRHKLKGRKLNRTSSHRKALLMNLSIALLKHELIKTTLPKAKELRPFVEKLMTIAKTDNLANRRRLLSILNNDKETVNKLFSDIVPRIKTRNGGYTRIMHCGFRAGDKAPMAVIELVDRNDSENTESKKAANDSDKKPVKKATKKEESTKEVSAKKETPKKEAKAKKSDSKK